MPSRAALGLVAAALFAVAVPTTARADEKATCLAAASKGQKLRNAHKLVEAREQLRTCAAATCPAVLQTDCAGWLAELEKALPSVVVTAKNGAGTDLVDVKVSVDGQPFTSKLDGQAVVMNAGPHTFHLEAADGTALDQQVVIREGEKNQAVAVVLGTTAAAPAPAPPAPVSAPASPAASSPPPDTSAAPASPSSPWRTVGWVLGGAGVAGLGVGTIFGIIALGDKSSAHCDASNACDPGTSSGIKSSSLVADIGFIAGSVLLASGAALVLFAPGGQEGSPAATSVRVVPVVTASGGSMVLGAGW